MTAVISRAPGRIGGFAKSWWAWGLLVLIAAAALSLGSMHASAPSAQQRAAYLDSIIKCPSCDNLSIAQSDAGVAAALRREVRHLVGRGWSNERIESAVVAQYGSNEILAPSSDLVWVIPLVIGGLAASAIVFALGRSRVTRRKVASADEERLVEAAIRHLEETVG